MEEGMNAFVVESPVVDASGTRVGIARVYVATEVRAQEIANAHPARAYRAIPFEDMPEKARANLLRA
jgi:hypothetical protein